jgi:hypothetical protein
MGIFDLRDDGRGLPPALALEHACAPTVEDICAGVRRVCDAS